MKLKTNLKNKKDKEELENQEEQDELENHEEVKEDVENETINTRAEKIKDISTELEEMRNSIMTFQQTMAQQMEGWKEKQGEIYNSQEEFEKTKLKFDIKVMLDEKNLNREFAEVIEATDLETAKSKVDLFSNLMSEEIEKRIKKTLQKDAYEPPTGDDRFTNINNKSIKTLIQERR